MTTAASPKRKQPGSMTSSLTTNPIPDLSLPDIEPAASPRASDSPRTLVASQFSTMELHDPRPPPQSTHMDYTSSTPRKRARLSSPAQHSRFTLPTSPPISPAGAGVTGLNISLAPPHFGPALPSTPTTTPGTSPLKPSLPTQTVSPLHLSQQSPRKQRRRLRSPSPHPVDADLAWTAAEITGHEIDATSPDDADGLGINGVGFEASPLEEERRRDRRRAQVSEWRKREAREERRRRCERRRGEGVGENGGGSTEAGVGEEEGRGRGRGRRGVRFVGEE
ncbi:hypothetical protein K461DRAFT_311624 [Myriangium duriaei CBS 260.36]|uniref:Uncharacterized protein n=1 Tax=Myriangium duriaei CBS 260.36 TaxID=1168546 RepID=A0A9P4JAM3_9PEZI|nr:hypothetical protein K461DRAFT_311624 [Myriangium duriaei CBS 260.36]